MNQDQRRVMVVDDDRGMRTTLEVIIEEEGFHVVGAGDGYGAIELAREGPFALILMDIRMPGMNGVDAYREIRKLIPDCTVVMMTGFSAEELVREALAEGAYAVIYKPFDVGRIGVGWQ